MGENMCVDFLLAGSVVLAGSQLILSKIETLFLKMTQKS